MSDTRAQTCGRECHSGPRRCRRKLEITFTLYGASPSRGHAKAEPTDRADRRSRPTEPNEELAHPWNPWNPWKAGHSVPRSAMLR